MKYAAIKKRIDGLIERMGRYLKTDMRYLVAGSFWNIADAVIGGGIAFCTAIAFANLLPKEVYGTYQYILSGVTLLGLLALPATKSAIFYAAARNKDGSFIDAVRTKIKWNFLAAGGAVIVAVYYYFHQNLLLAGAFAIVAFFTPFWEVFGTYVNYLLGKKRFKEVVFYEDAAQLLNAIVIITIILFTKNVLALLVGFFLSWSIARIYLFRRVLKKYPPNNERDPDAVTYGKHLSLMNVITSLASNLDKLLLWQLLGPVGVASYTFALTVPTRATSILTGINRLYFPKAVNHDLPAIRTVLVSRVLYLTLAASVLAGTYAVIAPGFFALFFPKYLESVPYTQALAVLMALQPATLFGTALSAHARKKELYIVNIAPAILQIGLFCILIPTMHIWGAVFSIALTQLVESALSVALFYRASRS
jgi:O-antigen/teichoic acid export membrane protein